MPVVEALEKYVRNALAPDGFLVGNSVRTPTRLQPQVDHKNHYSHVAPVAAPKPLWRPSAQLTESDIGLFWGSSGAGTSCSGASSLGSTPTPGERRTSLRWNAISALSPASRTSASTSHHTRSAELLVEPALATRASHNNSYFMQLGEAIYFISTLSLQVFHELYSHFSTFVFLNQTKLLRLSLAYKTELSVFQFYENL